MRNKKHGAERIAACDQFRISEPEILSRDPASVFPMSGPLHLEIGCGKGAFACHMADAHPDICFIAMERIPNVACNALENAKRRLEEGPEKADNLRILIGNAARLNEILPEHSIDVIYLNFSDPWPKAGHVKRRLTYRSFLSIYKTILKPGGILRFKTDNADLFTFSVEEFKEFGLEFLYLTDDLHNDTGEYAETNIMTEYEQNFSSRGYPIHMAVVRF